MTTRRVAEHPASIHPLILGGNVFGWGIDREGSFAVLDAFLEGGGTAIDTANVYSGWVPGNRGGESETIIGEWLRDRGVRDRVFLATKVGMASGDFAKGLTRDQVRAGLHDSLRRLGTDHVDLFYAHEDDEGTPLAETVAAFGELVQDGSVGMAGASNYTAARLEQALDAADAAGVPGFRVLQPSFNLIDRDDYPSALEDLCTRRGLAVMPYYTLARGFLTGKYRRDRATPHSVRSPGVLRDYSGDRPAAALKVVDTVVGETGATPAQVALAWLMARPSITGPIASATTPDQVRELLAAADVRLSADQVARLDAVGGR